MTKLPESVRVGPIIYKIVLSPNMHEGRNDLDGAIRYSAETIEIDGSVADATAVQTLWHEILHAILQHAGRRKHSERWVDSTAYGLMQVVVDNPELIEITREVVKKK